MIWIIGQYADFIDNSVSLISDFAENFNEESKNVQMAILTAAVKVYLKMGDEAEDLVTQVIQLSTDESDNPDLRNRGYIYWRMLSENPEEAKSIILCDKPTISEDFGNFDGQLLDKLIANVSMLSSVYYKPPEAFAKKVRDRINERLDLEYEEQDQPNDLDYEDSTGVKKSEYIKDVNDLVGNYNDLIIQDAKEEGLP